MVDSDCEWDKLSKILKNSLLLALVGSSINYVRGFRPFLTPTHHPCKTCVFHRMFWFWDCTLIPPRNPYVIYRLSLMVDSRWSIAPFSSSALVNTILGCKLLISELNLSRRYHWNEWVRLFCRRYFGAERYVANLYLRFSKIILTSKSSGWRMWTVALLPNHTLNIG